MSLFPPTLPPNRLVGRPESEPAKLTGEWCGKFLDRWRPLEQEFGFPQAYAHRNNDIQLRPQSQSHVFFWGRAPLSFQRPPNRVIGRLFINLLTSSPLYYHVWRHTFLAKEKATTGIAELVSVAGGDARSGALGLDPDSRSWDYVIKDKLFWNLLHCPNSTMQSRAGEGSAPN